MEGWVNVVGGVWKFGGGIRVCFGTCRPPHHPINPLSILSSAPIVNCGCLTILYFLSAVYVPNISNYFIP
ncbi:hypothetical protein BDQ12DRAFT_677894 [Crucibulum laeve]|uniref:Uncharacterized protein n=1 Tax=Crucibulum laeve TaxID=68775 RepID=A0A5C3MC77_9AGAR|nr:hypothetical protein BDQ12DRAFT_677894 [Crucibulum laeve]